MSADWRALYPFRGDQHRHGGLRQHLLDEGDGPVVVAVHGNPTWSFYWRRLVLSLRERCRVIVPDHIGCGLSDKPQQRDPSLADHIDALESLLQARVFDRDPGARVVLVVHDWGGAIGLGWAVRHPDRVAGLVVTNTAAFPGPVPWRIRLCRSPIWGALLVQGFNGFLGPALTMGTTRPGGLPPDVRAGYLHPYPDWPSRRSIYRFVRDIPVDPSVPSHAALTALEAGLSRLADIPMSLQWGGRDFCFTPWFYEEFRRRFPRAEAELHAEAGHFLMEDAGEAVCARVAQMVTEVGA